MRKQQRRKSSPAFGCGLEPSSQTPHAVMATGRHSANMYWTQFTFETYIGGEEGEEGVQAGPFVFGEWQ